MPSSFSVAVETLTASVPDRYKERHDQMIRQACQQLSAKDEFDNNSLHTACYNQPPSRAVEALLEAATAADLALHRQRARDGSTSLQTACACGADIAVIRILVEAPGGADLVVTEDHQGATPLTELTVEYTLQAKAHRRAPLLENVNLLDDQRSPVFDRFWSKVELLLQAAASREDLVTPWRRDQATLSIVHTCASIASAVPPLLSELVCRCYPHMISFGGRHDCLPMHLAVAGQWGSESLPGLTRRTCMIQILLQVYPMSVTRPMLHTHRSLLCQALVSGLPWWISESAPGPVQLLYERAPHLLTVPDTVTQLPLFCLAAKAAMDHEARQVDTIFNILKRYPQALYTRHDN